MRSSRTLRTALVAAGVTAALGVSAAGAIALPASQTGKAAPAAHATDAPSKTERVHVKTVRLADKVSTAKVYTTGKYRYEAEIWAKGVKYATLYTNGKAAPPAHAENNGLHVTLHPNGKVTSSVERAEPKPVAKRVLIADATLADGTSTAKVYKLAAGHYEADIFAGATKIDTLVAEGHTAHGQNNGLHVALQPDGQLASWAAP
jgi:hypothetical protein